MLVSFPLPLVGVVLYPDLQDPRLELAPDLQCLLVQMPRLSNPHSQQMLELPTRPRIGGTSQPQELHLNS